MSEQLPFRLTAPALNHDGSVTPFAEYIKFVGDEPLHSASTYYPLSRLPADSELLKEEIILVNYDTGEFSTRARREKDNEEDEDGENELATNDEAIADSDDEEAAPSILQRLNIKVIFAEFSKCLVNTGYEFKLCHSDLTMDGMLPHSYRAIYKLEGKNAIVTFEVHGSGGTSIDIHADDHSIIDNIFKVTDKESIKYRYKAEKGESYIHFICRNDHGYFTHQFEISDGINFEEIFDNYNDDFRERFSDGVMRKLCDLNCSKGIVLLHGPPGTGKTTYLRYILSKVKKKVMYLPPELGHAISDPGFITFLMSNPNSILCIEDAENIIKTRESGGNQAVSNILNITDGILGSALKYQVICTFNAEFTEIDAALKRKGRMIGEYEFKALTPSKTKFLVEKLYGEGVKPTEPSMTLAEIHTMMEDMPHEEKVSRPMGFL
jgi:hypothetical protein